MGRRRSVWAMAVMAAVGCATMLAGAAAGSGPVGVADGEPAGDSRLSVLTPSQQAFADRKLVIAATIGVQGLRASKASRSGAATVTCEYDPCGGGQLTPSGPPATAAPTAAPTGQPAPPSVPTPPAAKTLATKARQQINSYSCGPASGQVVINWSRGYTSGSTSGEDVTTNWRKQSKIAEWMSTTTAGTAGANLAIGLNNANAVQKPTSDWIYIYADNGSMQELYGKIVTDVAMYGMPLVLATAPHISGAGANYLESWANYVGPAHHWIVVRGYTSSPADVSQALIQYQDSSGGYGGSTGSFDDKLAVIWQVSKWNQGGHVVW